MQPSQSTAVKEQGGSAVYLQQVELDGPQRGDWRRSYNALWLVGAVVEGKLLPEQLFCRHLLRYGLFTLSVLKAFLSKDCVVASIKGSYGWILSTRTFVQSTEGCFITRLTWTPMLGRKLLRYGWQYCKRGWPGMRCVTSIRSIKSLLRDTVKV